MDTGVEIKADTSVFRYLAEIIAEACVGLVWKCPMRDLKT